LCWINIGEYGFFPASNFKVIYNPVKESKNLSLKKPGRIPVFGYGRITFRSKGIKILLDVFYNNNNMQDFSYSAPGRAGIQRYI